MPECVVPELLNDLEVERAKLLEQFLSLGEKICALRPVEEERSGWTPQEKKRLLRSIRKFRGK